MPDALPADWRAGLASLAFGPPPAMFNERRWRALIADARGLACAWGPAAAALGWNALDLFGCAPGFARRLDCDGLAMLLAGRPVLALDAETATIANRAGAPHVYRRCLRAKGVTLWQAREVERS